MKPVPLAPRMLGVPVCVAWRGRSVRAAQRAQHVYQERQTPRHPPRLPDLTEHPLLR
eukprot:CAMPEP_0182856686 /NCGR_PEP_ID=MMETSP0034_2-20130328/2593_1 /TAXON_ID=156128 /ORGANISM="Nephroselmis pyriformis, Strain CCMP717" /LENGTH=56 /DNA_ID=CAMNT_0024987809 /DNA_START=52 /DNA_END=222 /DNA_ORIENTATION=+